MLSIIVPIYNAEKYLYYCLESIRRQTYKDFECILVDDGSNDGSGEICNKFCELDNRFRYFPKKNGGVASARNYGLDHVNGELISFVDNDDVINKYMYEILIGNLMKCDADVSCCRYNKTNLSYEEIVCECEKSPINRENVEVCVMTSWNPLRSVTKTNEDGGIEGLIWNKVYKKEFIAELRFRENVALVDDAVFSIELFNRECVCVQYMEALYYWMQHTDNQTSNSNIDRYVSAINGYEYILEEVITQETAVRHALQGHLGIWCLILLEKSRRKPDKMLYKQYTARIRMLYKYARFCAKGGARIKLFFIKYVPVVYRVWYMREGCKWILQK